VGSIPTALTNKNNGLFGGGWAVDSCVKVIKFLDFVDLPSAGRASGRYSSFLIGSEAE
jgi:hypothetical protein